MHHSHSTAPPPQCMSDKTELREKDRNKNKEQNGERDFIYMGGEEVRVC